jgi:hypothetical protein
MFGVLTPHDESRSFAFAEGVHRPERGWNFSVSRNAAKNENPVVYLGLHVLQQRLKAEFARHNGCPSKELCKQQ